MKHSLLSTPSQEENEHKMYRRISSLQQESWPKNIYYKGKGSGIGIGRYELWAHKMSIFSAAKI